MTVVCLLIVEGRLSLTSRHCVSWALLVIVCGNVPLAAVLALTHSSVGAVIGRALPVTTYFTWYWVFQEAISVVGLLIVMAVLAEEPVYPFPLQPLNRYRVPVAPLIVCGAAMVTVEPASYQPWPVGLPYADDIVR